MTYHMEKGFYGKMLKLALPIALQNLLASCAGLIDTAMVVGLGNTVTAAIGIAGRWTFFFNIILFGFCSGGSAMISQFWGARDRDSIHKTYGLAISVSMCIGIVYNIVAFCFPEALMRVYTPEADVIAAGAVYLRNVSFMSIFYTFNMISGAALRATEDVFTPLMSNGFSVLMNTVLNYILINGKLGFPALGLQGAAYATVISTALGSLVMFFIARLKKGVIIASFKKLFGYSRQFVRNYFRIAAPVLGNEILWAVGTNIYVMVLARQGSENYAGYTMYNSIEQIAFVFFVGVCNACAIMVGKSVGEGKLEEAYQKGKRFVFMTPIMGVVVGTALIFLRNPILSLLPIETEYARSVASGLLLIYALWLPVRMISYTSIVGVFRAGGDTKIGFFFDMINVFCIAVPTVIILGMFVKVNFLVLVAAMFIAEDTLKTYQCLKHFVSRRWIRRLTMPGDNAV